jgi:hypothetical protein
MVVKNPFKCTGSQPLFMHMEVRYFAIEHMEVRREASQICTTFGQVRPGTGRETGLGHVRRDCFSVARHIRVRREASRIYTATVMVCVIPDLIRDPPCLLPSPKEQMRPGFGAGMHLCRESAGMRVAT